MITATVEIVRITFVSPTTDWVVAKCVLDPLQDTTTHTTFPDWMRHGQEFAVVGPLGKRARGELIDVIAEPVHNARYGWQLQAKLAQKTLRADHRTVAAFLQGFTHIGPIRASKIITHFGDFHRVCAVLDAGGAELAQFAGITAARAKEIADEFARAKGQRDALLFCLELELSAAIARRVIERWAGQARALVTDDPYILLEIRGLSFKEIDAIAYEHFGVMEDDPRRLTAAAMHILQATTLEGHCYCTLAQIFGPDLPRAVVTALRDVDLPQELLTQGFQLASEPRMQRTPPAVREGERYFPIQVWTAECALAHSLQRLSGTIHAGETR